MDAGYIHKLNEIEAIFWIIALPFTLITVLPILFIAYSGDGFKERFASIFRRNWRHQESYASQAVLSYSEAKEKSVWPDIVDIAGSSIAGEPYDRHFSWRTPTQTNNLIPNTYGPPPLPPSMRLATRLAEQPLSFRVQNRAEAFPPPYGVSTRPYPVQPIHSHIR
jgi:hypothetical protein